MALTYALVTPARDEAENLARLASCVKEQTVQPAAWVVVDDGSTDGTLELAQQLAAELPWLRALSSPGAQTKDGPIEGGRRAGRDIVAFTSGVAELDAGVDVVVKLDADVSFGRDFFAQLLAEFDRDPRLGIASGTCWERRGGEWRPYHVTGGHVRGATRAYRRQCLRDVGPLEELIGWDVVDEVRARLAGWHTRSLPELAFYHHRSLGERDGARRQWHAQGVMAHYLGYRVSYVVLRALWRARREPAAFAMIPAFLAAKRRGEPRHPDGAVRSYMRQRQALRSLPLRLREARGRG